MTPPINTRGWKPGATLLVLAALLSLPACSSTPHPSGPVRTTSGAAYETDPGFGGEMVVESVATTNTVVSIDAGQRRLELKRPDGRITLYKAGPGVANFDQIKAGDQVIATVVEEMAVYVKPASSALSVSASDLTVRAAPNAGADRTEVETLSLTARVLGIDPVFDTVALQTADGRIRTVRVSEYVNLADFNVGDDVSVRITRATTLTVDKP
jgi:hypothetical protein